MGALSERIASIKDGTTKVVTVPEWDDTAIEVRSLSLGERNRIMIASKAKRGGEIDPDRYYAAIIVATCYEPESGERAFDAGDIPMLKSKSGAALDRLAKTAMRLSGLLDDEAPEGDDDVDSEYEDAIESAGKGSSSRETFEHGS